MKNSTYDMKTFKYAIKNASMIKNAKYDICIMKELKWHYPGCMIENNNMLYGIKMVGQVTLLPLAIKIFVTDATKRH